MDSYGEILQNKREEKNLDIDKISREISIESRYLKGLELEDTSVFPGEAYMVGYLRNYSNYLELDTDFILKLYHNKKIQESPIPEGLIQKRRPRWIIPAIIVPIVFLLGTVVTITILLTNKKKASVDESVILTSEVKNKQYVLDNTNFTSRVYKGDQFLVPSENSQLVLTVNETGSMFGLETPSGIYYTELAEENEIDIDGDSVVDLIVYVSDISNTDESRGAEVSLMLCQYKSAVSQNQIFIDEIPLESEIKSKHPHKVLIEDNRPYPFTINVDFRGSCLFRSKVDNSNSVENYFTRGERFTANPHNGIRLWISDSNVVKMSIIADSHIKDLDIGIAGRVLVEDIKWIIDSDGKYKLVVIELD